MNNLKMAYLDDIDRYNTLLRFDSKKGPLGEVPRFPAYDKASRYPGRFTKISEEYYCVYASPKGPHFYCPAGHFLIADPACNFIHERGEATHRFVFQYTGQPMVDLTYPHWHDVDIDPWSTEDWIDFFIWLTDSIHDPAFHSRFTHDH